MSDDDFGMWDDEVLEGLKDGAIDKARQMLDGLGEAAESLGLDDEWRDIEGLFDGQDVSLADEDCTGHGLKGQKDVDAIKGRGGRE